MGHWPGSFMRLASSVCAEADDNIAQEAQRAHRTPGSRAGKRVRPRTNICKDLHGSDEAVRHCRPVYEPTNVPTSLGSKEVRPTTSYLTTLPDTPAPRSTAI